jgi:hypothetical protein
MRRCFAALLFVCVCVSTAFAQSVSGTITGFVKDPQDAAITAASVTARHTQTGTVVSVMSGEDGYYRLQNLIPGEHFIEISATGFRTFRSDPQIIGVSEPVRLDAMLQLGATSESITVEAAATRVSTEDNQLGETIREFSRLPLLSGEFGRTPLELLSLSAGAIPNLTFQPGVGSFNGQRTYSNNTMFDGAYANNQLSNNPDFAAFFISPNAVAEVRAVTGVPKAEFGRNSGSTIIVTPKSGGNDWHGGVYDAFRNTRLNSAAFFLKAVPGGTRESLPNGAPRNPPWNSNDFDANLGGPIVRDKTFFFVSYLGLRQHHGIVRSAVVPNNSERAIIAAEGTPAARALLNLIPPATVGNTLLSSPSNSVHGNEVLGKVDHAVSKSNRFSATYFIVDSTTRQPFNFFSPIPGFGTVNEDRQQNFVLRDSHIFSPRWIHEVRAAYTRTASNDFQPQNQTKLASLGLGAIVPDNRSAEGPPFVSIAGFSPFGNTTTGPQVNTINNFQVIDNVSWSGRRHFVKFGGEFKTFAFNMTYDLTPNGLIAIDGSGSLPVIPLFRRIPGLTPALNDFANGFAVLFRQTSSAELAHRSHSTALFLQDDWRIVNGFTINAGLRWEYNSPYTDAQDRLVSFHPGVQSKVFPDAPIGLVYPGDPGVPRATYNGDFNDFSPRLGFAWDVLRNGKLSLRGGYGLMFDAPFDEILFGSAILSPPYNISPGTLATAYANPWLGSLINPIPQPFPYDPPQPGARVNFRRLAPINFNFLEPGFRTPYVQQWNLQIQNQFYKDWLLEVGYVGNVGRKLSNQGEYNYAIPGPLANSLNVDARRIINLGLPSNLGFDRPVYGSVGVHRGNANSSYNGLQIQASRRFGKGFYMSHAYTWSHAIDNASGGRVSSRPNPAEDRGDSDQDMRHVYTLGYVYELPFYRQQAGAVSRILGGWGISGRTTIASGLSLSIVEPEDRCLCATGNQRADSKGKEIVYVDPRSTTAVAGRPHSWFDGTGGGTPTASENPYFRRVGSGPSSLEGAGRYGSAGRNTIRTPGFNIWNLSVFKRTTVKEGHVLEFRSEFYNVPNHTNFLGPDVNIGAPTFGIVSETRDPRIIQLVVKYEF